MNQKKSFEFIVKSLGEALKDKKPFLVIVPAGDRVAVMGTGNFEDFLSDCMLKSKELERTVLGTVVEFMQKAKESGEGFGENCDCETCEIREDCPIEHSKEESVRTGLSFAGKKFDA